MFTRIRPDRPAKLLFIAVLLAAPAVRAQSAAPPALATLAGKAVNSVTGEPVRKADITLSNSPDTGALDAAMRMFSGGGADTAVTMDASLAKPETPAKTFKATTDGNGEFHIDKIEPGDYYLTAAHAGYADGKYKPDTAESKEGKIHFAASEAVKGIVFHLVPQGAVSGRVVDEDGDPVPGAMVSALSNGRATGRQLMPVDTSPANDRGEFRLGKLPPGSYYLSGGLLRMDFMGAAPPAAPADGSPEMNYVTTYFPGMVDVTTATKIDVAAGADLTGFTIKLRKSRVVRVKGQALAADGTPLKGGQVMLTSPSSIGSMQMSALHSDGTFEIANVQPGSYMLMSVQINGGQPSMQMQSLMVPEEGVSGVKLRALPEQTVQGKVVVADNGKVALKDMMVMLAGDEGMTIMPAMGKVSDSGAFTLKVSGASYRLELPKTPPGSYVKSVVWGGREMLGKALDFSAGAAGELVVTLGVDGGKVDATVSAEGGKPAPEATVVLVPYDSALRSEATVKDEDADANGHVTFTDVPPGEYLAFAWQEVDGGAWLRPDFLKPFEKDAKHVTIEPRGSEKVDLRQIPAAR